MNTTDRIARPGRSSRRTHRDASFHLGQCARLLGTQSDPKLRRLAAMLGEIAMRLRHVGAEGRAA